MGPQTDVRFLVVTGLSGAGKTEATRALEDLGFFCIDNLPPTLIPKFAELLSGAEGRIRRIAVVMDIRGREFFADLFAALTQLESQGFPYRILFLEANEEVLLRRYKGSRRRHPLAPQGRLLEGIKEERRRLEEMRGHAHYLIDTSRLTPQELRREVERLFAEDRELSGMIVSLITFGFKHGLPMDADLVLDVRFLPNPHWVPSLRSLTGNDAVVEEYVLRWPLTQQFLQQTTGFLDFLLPHYTQEGKAQLTIAVGCTGGRHRSVVLGNQLAAILRERGRTVLLKHRDVAKGEPASE